MKSDVKKLKKDGVSSWFVRIYRYINTMRRYTNQCIRSCVCVWTPSWRWGVQRECHSHTRDRFWAQAQLFRVRIVPPSQWTDTVSTENTALTMARSSIPFYGPQSASKVFENVPKDGTTVRCFVPKEVLTTTLLHVSQHNELSQSPLGIEDHKQTHRLLINSNPGEEQAQEDSGSSPASHELTGKKSTNSLSHSLAHTATSLHDTMATLQSMKRSGKSGQQSSSFWNMETPDLPGIGCSTAELASESSRKRNQLVRRGGNDREPPKPQQEKKQLTYEETEVFKAAELGDLDDLKRCLLQVETNLSIADMIHPQHGATPLHVFASSEIAEEFETAEQGIKILTMFGAEINARAGNGSTPLHWAAGAGNEGAVQALLAAGAEPWATTYTWRRQVFGKGSGQTPLHWASESGNERVVDLLASYSVETIVAGDERGQTPLSIANKHGHRKMEEKLQMHANREYVCIEVAAQQSGMREINVPT